MIFRLRINFVSILNIKLNVQVFLSFNIDRCQSILNDKITISLYYNNKLDVENEKRRLDRFATKCKLNERGWQIPCEIATYVSNFDYRSVLFNQEFVYITAFEYRRPIDETFIMLTMRIVDQTEDNNDNIQNSL